MIFSAGSSYRQEVHTVDAEQVDAESPVEEISVADADVVVVVGDEVSKCYKPMDARY